MSIYPITCRAYYADGSQILGNLDGQRSLKSVEEMRAHYDRLCLDVEEGRHKCVAYWLFETENGKVKLRLSK